MKNILVNIEKDKRGNWIGEVSFDYRNKRYISILRFNSINYYWFFIGTYLESSFKEYKGNNEIVFRAEAYSEIEKETSKIPELRLLTILN